MSNVIKLNINKNVVPFDFGEFTLDFNATDERERQVVETVTEVKAKAELLDENGTEWELRSQLKGLIDECLAAMFDEDAPQRIYGVCGQQTMAYLEVFLQIGEALKQRQQERENSETFKKYLSE